MIQIRHNLCDDKITTCETEQQFIDFTRDIMIENGDAMSTDSIADCKYYINTFCQNLDLL